ncbi:MAG: hypothetical protein ABIR18_01470, partial [Chitinophagaceae bacterium]
MTHLDFQKSWTEFGDDLEPISAKTLDEFKLSKDAKEFLGTVGLPNSAAPFLGFVGDVDREKYKSISLLTSWFDFLDDDFEKYIAIGSDGSGDVIALNTDN